jgi:hypothetical protein
MTDRPSHNLDGMGIGISRRLVPAGPGRVGLVPPPPRPDASRPSRAGSSPRDNEKPNVGKESGRPGVPARSQCDRPGPGLPGRSVRASRCRPHTIVALRSAKGSSLAERGPTIRKSYSLSASTAPVFGSYRLSSNKCARTLRPPKRCHRCHLLACLGLKSDG